MYTDLFGGGVDTMKVSNTDAKDTGYKADIGLFFCFFWEKQMAEGSGYKKLQIYYGMLLRLGSMVLSTRNGFHLSA
jgi:hypothetical protein